MKKYSLLKTLTITFLIFVILSWFIDGGYLYNGTYYAAEGSTKLGLGSLFSLPIQSFGLYVEFGLIFLIIGGFYGVLNKIGVYTNITNKVINCFKKKPNLFLILTTLFFLAFESVMGSSMLAFTLVPFFATILYGLGYSKNKTMMATVGSIIIATFASTLGLASITNYLLDLGKSDLLGIKIMLFVITAVVMIVGLLLTEKKHIKTLDDYEESIKKPLDVSTPIKEKKGSTILFMIIIIFFGLLLIIGTYNWEQCLGISMFANFSTNVLSKISILNGFSPLGGWGTKELAAIILIVTIIISLVYRIKIKDMIEAFKDGAKPMLKVSFYVTLCSVFLAYYYTSETGYNFIDTIVNNIYNSSSEYLALKTAASTPIAGIMLNQPMFLVNSISTLIKSLTTNTATLGMAGLSLQMSLGVSMLFLPTSTMLIAGLAYFDIPYLKWLRYAYKYILIFFLIMGIIVLI